MSSVFEEYAEKYAEKYVEKYVEKRDEKTAINMLKEDMPIELIAKVIPTISIEKIKELKEELEK